MSGAAEQQIKTQFETLGMTVEEIAEVGELEPATVRSVLMSVSPVYRESQGTGEKKADFQHTDEELALSVIRRVAQYSEEDSTALKAAMFIRNDKRGRLDPKVGLNKLQLNVAELNVHFQQAVKALSTSVQPQTPNPPVIDVTPAH